MIIKNTQARNKTKQLMSNFSKEKVGLLQSLINTQHFPSRAYMAGSGPDTKAQEETCETKLLPH